MSAAKTPGQVAYEAAESRVSHLTHKVIHWSQQGDLTQADYEHIAAAVIAHHEAAQWQPMIKPGGVISEYLLVAFEDKRDCRRFVGPCVVNWCEDGDGRYTDDCGEPLFEDYSVMTALAWRKLPGPPDGATG